MEALNPHHLSSSGLLIANDSDYKRTHMLVHQTGRMPSKGLVVTNLDACVCESVGLSLALTIAAALPHISIGEGKTLQFDRILADVP